MRTYRLTMAQALVKYLTAQFVDIDGERLPLVAGVFAIFGHGNVAGLGEALYQVKDKLPTYRAHNEQAMAHSAIAYAKTLNRRQIMAATTSIGPGALNMVTAAGLAYANRLPVLLLPGDIFASRSPDPVLQQIECQQDATLSANDCFKPVSRYFDRIMRPEQLIKSLPQAMRVLTDPVECGPVTIALPQDVQAMSYDYPASFFEPKVHYLRRLAVDEIELADALEILVQAKKPFVIAGGGVHYSLATEEFRRFVETYQLPVGETQAGKGALPWDHPCNMGSIGVTGSSASNTLAQEADVIFAVGTRFEDFTTGSWALFSEKARIVSLNVNGFDAIKHRSYPLIGDAKRTLPVLQRALSAWKPESDWVKHASALQQIWYKEVDCVTQDKGSTTPTDAQVIGIVNQHAQAGDIVVCAAGGLPGELHKLWRTTTDKGYHVEYGFSCMGYEIAGGMGVKMAQPNVDVYVMVGDGSYLMLNSEIATSVMLGVKLIIVVLNNEGFGCINRLQQVCGGEGFNNLWKDCHHTEIPVIDFAAHAKSLGANSESVVGIAALSDALVRAKKSDKTYVIALDTDPITTTEAGGTWWEVGVPEVSPSTKVQQARQCYDADKTKQQQ